MAEDWSEGRVSSCRGPGIVNLIRVELSRLKSVPSLLCDRTSRPRLQAINARERRLSPGQPNSGYPLLLVAPGDVMQLGFGPMSSGRDEVGEP
jgi:hypothetical protein